MTAWQKIIKYHWPTMSAPSLLWFEHSWLIIASLDFNIKVKKKYIFYLAFKKALNITTEKKKPLLIFSNTTSASKTFSDGPSISRTHTHTQFMSQILNVAVFIHPNSLIMSMSSVTFSLSTSNIAFSHAILFSFFFPKYCYCKKGF